MSKNIVFCADGTWNHPSEPDGADASSATNSNVFKLFLKLEGKDLAPHGSPMSRKKRCLPRMDR